MLLRSRISKSWCTKFYCIVSFLVTCVSKKYYQQERNKELKLNYFFTYQIYFSFSALDL